MADKLIEEAKSWLKSGILNQEGRNYSKSVYALEMALEIALKSVVASSGRDVPRRHDIVPPLEEIILSKPKIFSTEFKNAFISIKPVFMELLIVRQARAYSYETSIKEEDFMTIFEQNYQPVKNMIETCEKELERKERNLSEMEK